MNIKKKKKILLWLKRIDNQYLLLGFFFLFMQFFVFLGNFQADRYDVFFWFCNHTPLFFSFAFFLKKRDIIKGLINVGFLGQFAWTLDFLGKLLFNVHIFNMTGYVFTSEKGFWVLLPIIIHIFATNIALYFSRKKKPTIKTLFYSMLYLMFLFGATLTYTDPQRNVNCIYALCGAVDLTFNNYTNFWLVLVFFLVVLPTQGIQYLLYRYSTKKNKKK